MQWQTIPPNGPAAARLLFDVHAHEIFVNGCFNADPHAGNIFLCPKNKLGLIDYGNVQTLSKKQRINIANLMLALYHDDKEKIVQEMINCGAKSRKMDPHFLYVSFNFKMTYFF